MVDLTHTHTDETKGNDNEPPLIQIIDTPMFEKKERIMNSK